LRPRTYATLIGLIASTGLRTKEALRLSLKDVNLHEGVITIRETKFNKTRLVPLDKTVVHALREYADFREAYILIPQSANFFLGENGRRLGSNAIHWTFRRLCTACTLHSIPRGRNPRLYDLRHTFCTRRLLLWHQQGIDVEHSLLALSTYVGHVKVTDTYWYFSGVPELFAWIGAKFETYANKFKGDGL
jgi:integrase